LKAVSETTIYPPDLQQPSDFNAYVNASPTVKNSALPKTPPTYNNAHSPYPIPILTEREETS
jgi:hypothetical protein